MDDLQPIPVQVLGYASGINPPLPPARRSWLFRSVIVCWLLPLVVGLATLIVSEFARSVGGGSPFHHGKPSSEMFWHCVVCGLYTLIGGTALAVVGGILIVVFISLRWAKAINKWREMFAPALGLLFLLASNFVIAVIAIRIATR